MSIKKGKDTRPLRSLTLLLELERRLNLTLNSRHGFTYTSTTTPEPLQVENYKHSVVCSEFYHENPYIEVEVSFHQLNWVGLELMDDWVTIHVAGQLLLPVSTDFRTWDTLVNWLRRVAVMSRPEPTQSVAGRPRGWAGLPALVPLWLMVWPHMVYMSQTILKWHYL
jgi:hypothetical protein